MPEIHIKHNMSGGAIMIFYRTSTPLSENCSIRISSS